MACRLINLHPSALRVDLRSGGTLLLAPGEASPPLREELLYDNPHLGDWERAGWLRRVPARMSEVLAADAALARAPMSRPANSSRPSRVAAPAAKPASKPLRPDATKKKAKARRPSARS